MSISNWIDQKIVVHLYYGICSRKKEERTPTLCNCMDGTGKHYAKWNNPGDKRQINTIWTHLQMEPNQQNKQATQNQRHKNKEQTDSDQRGGGKG